MQEPTGHVTVNERVPTERFHRFVEEKLKDWIRDHGLIEQHTEYEVAFFDEESLGEVSCLVVIHAGNDLWRSWETADNPRIALARTLDNLRIEDDQADSEATQH